MNKLNIKLYTIPVVIVLAYMTLCALFTIKSVWSSGEFTILLFNPFDLFEGIGLMEATIPLSDLIPQKIWEAYMNLPNYELELIGNMIDSPEYMKTVTTAFVTIGFSLMVYGMVSGVSRNCFFKDEPLEYMFTSRPNSILKAVAMPWNSIADLWKHKYVGVIIPLFFLPFLIPFAFVAMVLFVIIFMMEKGIVGLSVHSAKSKDDEYYDREVGFSFCPVCKMSCRMPLVKCRCGKVVPYPVPGKYGISSCSCSKGHIMPCNNKNGLRGKLNMICPNCSAEMCTHEAKPFVISMVGSVGSGKTTLMVSATEQIAQAAKAKGMFTEISPGISVDIQKIKDVLPPTVSGELDTQQLFAWSRDKHDIAIQFNDISGTEFEPTDDRLFFQEYYKYSDGLIFTIDPMAVFALSNVSNSGKSTPFNALYTFYNTYTTINSFAPSVRLDVPLAIVLTKMDNSRAESLVSSEASPREFLKKYGQEDFLKLVDSTFTNVKYFSVASLGSKANPIEPVLWIAESKGAEIKNIL